MGLPKPIRPEWSTTVPSTGQKIKYQPFTVKEEKILMLAAESQNTDEMTNSVLNTLSNCITSPSNFDVESLALFDIEYLFLKTRAKSVGEKIKLKVSDPDDETFVVDHEINIDKIGITKNEKHTDLIEIDDSTTIKMKYPDISFFSDGIDLSNVETSTDIISRCISQIIIDEEVYNQADMSKEEIADWIDGLTMDKFSKIREFFETMPKLSHSFTLKNTNTGKNFTIKLEGLVDFF